jgi:hypothetical protein
MKKKVLVEKRLAKILKILGKIQKKKDTLQRVSF